MRSSAAPYGAHMPIGRLVVAWVDNLFRVSDARSFEHELGLAQGGEGHAVLCVDLRGMAEVGPDLLVELAQALGAVATRAERCAILVLPQQTLLRAQVSSRMSSSGGARVAVNDSAEAKAWLGSRLSAAEPIELDQFLTQRGRRLARTTSPA